MKQFKSCIPRTFNTPLTSDQTTIKELVDNTILYFACLHGDVIFFNCCANMYPYWETFFSVKSPKKRNDEKEERKNVFIISRDSFASLYNSIQIKCYGKEESVPFRDSFLSVCDTEQKDVLYTLHVDRNVLKTKEDEMQIKT